MWVLFDGLSFLFTPKLGTVRRTIENLESFFKVVRRLHSLKNTYLAMTRSFPNYQVMDSCRR